MQRAARLRELEAHPEVIAWKAASGMSVVEATLRQRMRTARLGRTTGGDPNGADVAAVRKRADAGDPEAALIRAMDSGVAPDDAIRYLEIAAVGGYTCALLQTALQYERKSLARGAHPLMLRLRRTADPEIGPLDEEYLTWLHAAALVGDARADHLLVHGLSTLTAQQDAVSQRRARDLVAMLDRKRAQRGLPALRGAPVTDVVREYVALRATPPDRPAAAVADPE